MDHHEHQHLFDVGGAHLSRLEDLRLIKGEGCYAADWNLPKQAHAVFLRADHAHAKIVSINTDAARKAPGVLGVYTGEDAVSAGQTQPLSMLTFPGKDGKKALIPKRPTLAHGHVRFVGDAVAMVVAETALQAQDAAELIEVEYEDLPVVIAPEAALAPGAPQLHDNVPGNLVFEQEAGDAAAVEAAFAEAAHVTKLKLDCTRVVPNPMEPRACLADYDAKSGVYTLHSPVQGINMMRMQLVTYTGIPEDKIKVVARDVGGGFGQRSIAYPEYCSVMMAAKALGRPVKWVSTRSESFLSDSHGRANYITAELALDKDGTFLGMRLDWIADLGAYLHPAGPVSPMRNPVTCLNGVYKTQALFGRWRVVLTNTSPVSAYRGAARPGMAYTIARLVDEAAAQMKIDPAEIRRVARLVQHPERIRVEYRALIASSAWCERVRHEGQAAGLGPIGHPTQRDVGQTAGRVAAAHIAVHPAEPDLLHPLVGNVGLRPPDRGPERLASLVDGQSLESGSDT